MHTLLSYVLLALAFAAVPGGLAAPVERAADTNFSATCTGISFNPSNNDLTATCQNAGGIGTATSTIGIKLMPVGNTNGELTAGNAFSASTAAGVGINTSLDLNSVMSNRNGLLTCP
ncbi:hypothetical protein C8R47DRAFT_1329615 [Mycena vitilis]|nr:hypothetical protein C8R47DRAFT_1329615 [Mycena vitilis]